MDSNSSNNQLRNMCTRRYPKWLKFGVRCSGGKRVAKYFSILREPCHEKVRKTLLYSIHLYEAMVGFSFWTWFKLRLIICYTIRALDWKFSILGLDSAGLCPLNLLFLDSSLGLSMIFIRIWGSTSLWLAIFCNCKCNRPNYVAESKLRL